MRPPRLTARLSKVQVNSSDASCKRGLLEQAPTSLVRWGAGFGAPQSPGWSMRARNLLQPWAKPCLPPGWLTVD